MDRRNPSKTWNSIPWSFSPAHVYSTSKLDQAEKTVNSTNLNYFLHTHRERETHWYTHIPLPSGGGSKWSSRHTKTGCRVGNHNAILRVNIGGPIPSLVSTKND